MLYVPKQNEKPLTFWKTIEQINFDDCTQVLIKLKKDGHIISHWIEDIVKRNFYSFCKHEFPIHLVRKKLKDFGFDRATELQDVYSQIERSGYQLVAPEIAIFSRKLYNEQPTGEWLRFATPLDTMIDSDGVRHLPKLGKALGSTFLETYWAYPQAIFHPHNEFVMVKK